MSALAHYASLKAALEAVPILSGRVFPAVRVTTSGETVRDNYLVAYPSAPVDLNERRYLAPQAPESTALYRWDLRSVAVDADGCLLYADAAMSIIGTVLDVPGRACSPLARVQALEEGRVGFDAKTRLYYVDFTVETYSRRA